MSNSEKEIKIPSTILEISRDFVKEFYKTASPEDKAWIQENINKHMKKSGNVKYFAGFRSEFGKKYYPELFANKKTKTKESLLEALRALDNEESEVK